MREDGFVIECGADSFISEKPWALALARRLALEGELIPPPASCAARWWYAAAA